MSTTLDLQLVEMIAANPAGTKYLSGNIAGSMRHMAAYDYMIEAKGGPESLGLDGFLAVLITWCREEFYAALKDKSFGKVRALAESAEKCSA